jgi:hypothetical protein
MGRKNDIIRHSSLTYVLGHGRSETVLVEFGFLVVYILNDHSNNLVANIAGHLVVNEFGGLKNEEH